MQCSFTSAFGNFYHSCSPHHFGRYNATLSQGPKKIAATLGGGEGRITCRYSALITQRQKPFICHQSLLHSSNVRISSTTDYREWEAKNKRRERLTRSRRTRSSRFRRGLRQDVSATPYLPFLVYFIFPSRSRDTFENVSVFSAYLNTTPE